MQDMLLILSFSTATTANLLLTIVPPTSVSTANKAQFTTNKSQQTDQEQRPQDCTSGCTWHRPAVPDKSTGIWTLEKDGRIEVKGPEIAIPEDTARKGA